MTFTSSPLWNSHFGQVQGCQEGLDTLFQNLVLLPNSTSGSFFAFPAIGKYICQEL